MDFENELRQTITSTRARLLEAQSMGIEITTAVEIFNKVGETASNLDYNGAFELLNKCNEKIDVAFDQHIFKIISDCYIQIKSYPKLDFSTIKVYLNDANYLLKNRNFLEAFQLANRSNMEIAEIATSNIEIFRNQAAEAFQDAKMVIEEARKDEELDIKDVEDIFSCMEENLACAEGINDYEDVIEYGNAVKNALARAKRRWGRVQEKLEKAQETLAKMKLALENVEKHFDLSPEIKEFHIQSEKALQDNEPDKAQELANECVKRLNDVTESYRPEITIKFISQGLVSEVWNRASISVENNGKAIANNVRLELTGPVQVRRIKPIDELGINETMSLDIGIKFEGGGNVPIDLEIRANRSWDDEVYSASQELWVEVDRTSPPVPRVKSATPEASRPALDNSVSCVI
ncbi:MAG: hypothetical protein KAJ51_12810, partial [Thermoplasmata archaeon]|nr:hypothetical protein [Thermoplasmata archaeon]